jgi:two-component system sensor histidine kinase KdpD
VVAVLGLFTGLVPALIAATVSFLGVDFFFVPPIHSLTIADETDLVNLLVFFGTAGVVGGLSSRRLRAQLQAEALSRHLQQANDELERMYREQEQAARTAVRLAQAQQQVSGLREADRLRRELLQNVSHELRTPLSAILTGTTSLLGRDDLPAAVRAELDLIVAQSRRLDRLVGDMLDMARIEGHAVQLHLEPVSLHEALDAAAQRLRRRHSKREVVLRADDDLTVLADWDRLAQVLDNLLGNADRYAPAGTTIELEAEAGARGVVVTRVIDHGPGVPEQLQSSLFDRFVRRPGGSAGGTGLGLAIAKGLVEAHAGRIWLDDDGQGRGTVFAFTLPAAPAVEPAPAVEAAPAAPAA